MNDLNHPSLSDIKKMYASGDYSAENLLNQVMGILDPYHALPAPETVRNQVKHDINCDAISPYSPSVECDCGAEAKSKEFTLKDLLERLPISVDLCHADGSKASTAEKFASRFTNNMEGMAAKWKIEFSCKYGMKPGERDLISAILNFHEESTAIEDISQ